MQRCIILSYVYPYVKSMKNNLVFVKPMNIFTANNSREKEVFIGALHNRAATLKTIKILND
jgi:predicted ATPase